MKINVIMRLFHFLSAAGMAISLAGCQSNQPDDAYALRFSGGQWIDLTYPFSDSTIYWPNNPEGFRLDTQFKGHTDAGFYYESYAFYAPEHGGTHLDAPIHFAQGKWAADEIPVDRLTGYAVVVDVSEKCKNNADYLITTEDVLTWEKQHGEIPGDAILFFRTGYGAFYPDAAKYLGTALKGDSGIANLHFPSIGPELAEWLVKNRKVKAVGVDVASVDYGQSKDFLTHQTLYRENIIGFENIAHLEKLPAKGAYVVALPMKIKGGSGGPLRIIAWVPAS
jgi:kynurenine formamidase